jgi:uncharacterized protein (TIGR00106 family)
MLIELSIVTLGRGTHMSKDLAEILKIVDDSHIRYALTPFGTCMEGEWDELMAVVKKCHECARSLSRHILTTIRIEDEAGVDNKLVDNVASVERAAGRHLSREVLVESE